MKALSDGEMVRACALACGWESFDVGYVGADDESPRQRELSDWMESVDLASIGEYWISVKDDVWIERELFNPLTNDAQAFALVKKFRLCVSFSIFINMWRVERLQEGVRVIDVFSADLNHAICECVANIASERGEGAK